MAPRTSTGMPGMDALGGIVALGDAGSTAHGDVWSCPDAAGRWLEETEGFLVQASDGALGKVQAASSRLGGSYLIVAPEEPWIGGRTVMLPAGVVEHVDRRARVISVQCSREQIVKAPRFENDRYQDAAYRAEVGRYYASSGCAVAAPAGPRGPPGLRLGSAG